MLTAVQILLIWGGFSCCFIVIRLGLFWPPSGLILFVSDFVVDEAAGRQTCLCICIYISHFKHSAELHTWFRAAPYFLGPSTHLSLSSGGPPSLPLASWVKQTSGGRSFGFWGFFCFTYSLSPPTFLKRYKITLVNTTYLYCSMHKHAPTEIQTLNKGQDIHSYQHKLQFQQVD